MTFIKSLAGPFFRPSFFSNGIRGSNSRRWIFPRKSVGDDAENVF